MAGFNPRARRGRDQQSSFRNTKKVAFQSTRPQGARQTGHNTLHLRRQVSIHAPAGGATNFSRRFHDAITFQSTRPQGARLSATVVFSLPLSVSIHAPAGGATQNPLLKRPESLLFQSTRPQGARLLPPKSAPIVIRFQSTRPQGARLDGGYRLVYFGIVSIHAPAGGATR